MRDDNKKYRLLSRRMAILGSFKLMLFGGLGARFYYLQALESDKYSTLSDKNRIKLSIIPPIRGLITDRNGIFVASNKIFYQLIIEHEYIKNAKEAIARVESILGYVSDISYYGIDKAIKESVKQRNHVIIQDNLSWRDISKIELEINLVGVQIRKSQKREYPLNNLLSHLTGYVSKPSKQEIKNASIPNYQEFQIGKNGLEKYFDSELQGSPGISKSEVDALGNTVRQLDATPAKIGNNIKLSIDSTIQHIISESMANLVGAVVIMHPYSGEILGLYSSPTYNPNYFINGINKMHWDELLNNVNKPLINKTISTAYPPGSIFKIVTGLSILASNIDPNEKVLCTGEHKFGDRVFHCWNKYGHGYVDFVKAIAKSCNVYFYVQGNKSGINNIGNVANILGLGKHTEIQLPFENPGFIPSKTWKKSYLKQEWQLGDTINTTIGQGYVLTTPIQLATMLSRIVTGKQVKPQISITQEKQYFPDIQSINLEHLKLILTGIHQAFYHPGGTGYNKYIGIKDIELIGKTGTAQVVSKRQVTEEMKKDHGLFVGLAPYKEPKFVISVVIEHGEWGAKSALPMAKKILTQLLC